MILHNLILFGVKSSKYYFFEADLEQRQGVSRLTAPHERLTQRERRLSHLVR